MDKVQLLGKFKGSKVQEFKGFKKFKKFKSSRG